MPDHGSGAMLSRPRLIPCPTASSRCSTAGCAATSAIGTTAMNAHPHEAAIGASTPQTTIAAAHMQPYAINVVA
jgi:hypothetical protein